MSVSTFSIDWPTLAIAAPFIGSFLCVIILRLPVGKTVVSGRSRCLACGLTIRPLDLVPILSWFCLRGHCRACGTSISPLYPAIEIAALAVVLWAATIADGDVLIASCILGWILLATAVIDWKTYLLPNLLTLSLFICGLVATLLLDPFALGAHIIGAIIGFLTLRSVTHAYRHFRKRDGLGLGDAKLLGGLGIWVSWEGLPSIILIASLLGLLFAFLKCLRDRTVSLTEPIPFGPFLALGGWLVWLYGPLVLG